MHVAGAIEIARWRRVSTIETAKATVATIASPSPSPLPAPASAEHHGDAGERDHHRGPGALRDPLSERDACDQRGDQRRDREDEEDVGDARVVEGHDEGAGGDRDADRGGEPRSADAPEGRDDTGAPMRDRDEREQADHGEERPPAELRADRDREVTLEEPGGGPRDGAERDEELAPAGPVGRFHGNRPQGLGGSVCASATARRTNHSVARGGTAASRA